MVTIVEVARRARVSASTVSHVINGTRYVAEGTRERVLAAIDAMGYRPNALARSLRRGHSQTLGLVVPDSANPFFAEVARELEVAAFEAGFSVILCNTGNDRERERLYVNVLAKKQVDGLLVIAAEERGDALRAIARSRVPVVALDREPPDANVDGVLADHLTGGALATRHLIALGHRRIACIVGPNRASPSAQRAAGYRRALEEAGLPLDEALMRPGDFRPESGWVAARALLALPQPPTAVFACNDLMALGVLRAAAERGRRVPEDLALVGYDDIELARYAVPALTTVAQPKREMARAAIRLLTRRIGDGALPPQREVLEVTMAVRQSCGAGRTAPAIAAGADGVAPGGAPATERQQQAAEAVHEGAMGKG